MPVERYFKEQDFKIGETIMIADEEYHHIIKVMRGKIGDQIELINGKGLLAYAYITNIGKKTVCCDIHELSKAYFPPPSVILIQAIPRFNRLEYILEKGTELGVTNFWLFPSERSERNTFSENQKQRMEHLIIAATKQCGRLDKPSLSIKKNLMDCLPLQGSVIFGDTRDASPFLWETASSDLTHPRSLFIGPESGFSSTEVAFLEQEYKAVGLRFHSHILRVDTAALVGLSLLQSKI